MKTDLISYTELCAATTYATYCVDEIKRQKVNHRRLNETIQSPSSISLSTPRIAMLLSPLALAACGGGEGDDTISGNMAPIGKTQFQVYSLGNYTTDTLASSLNIANEAFNFQPAATSFLHSNDGARYSIFFPTLFYKDPLLPTIVYSALDNKTVQDITLIQDFRLGNARDYAPIEWISATDNSIVIIDHGLEYSDGTEWPFGQILIATVTNGIVEFKSISDVKGFYHSVSVGDLTGNGLDDIAVLHMGVKSEFSKVEFFNIHTYLQDQSGTFTRTFSFNDNVADIAGYGGGAIRIHDLNHDGNVEIIRAAYVGGFRTHDERGEVNLQSSFQIFNKNEDDDFILTYSHPRVGTFLEASGNLGATKIEVFDFNQDGNFDIIISLEGGVPGITDKYLANSIEIFQNDGDGGFIRVTEEVLTQHVWLFSELQFREFEVIDVNGDGLPDFVLHGWQGSSFKTGSTSIDLAPLIFLNEGGESFRQLSKDSSIKLTLENLPLDIKFVRALESQDGKLDFFAMQENGLPLTISIDIA